MFYSEKKIIDYLLSKKFSALFVIISLTGLLIRLYLINFKSVDYTVCLEPWYQQIKSLGGIHALSHQVGNYGITYQFLIALFTYLPGKSLYWYKGLSIFFDFVLALSAGKLAVLLSDRKSKKIVFIFTYTIFLLVPTIFFNSSLWGQCDSIYVSFIVLSLLQLFQRKNISSFILLGIAFAFKFQTIFVIPFYLLVYLIRKDFSILYFLISFVSFYICCLPGIIMGRGLLAPIKIYLSQTANQPGLNFNYPNVTGLIAKDAGKQFSNYLMLHNAFIFLTFSVLCIGLVWMLYQNRKDNYNLLKYVIWIVWTFVMFMPDMHDRYGYLVEVLLLILTIIDTKYLLNIAILIINSLITYSVFLFGMNDNLIVLSYVSIINYLIFTFLVFSNDIFNNKLERILK